MYKRRKVLPTVSEPFLFSKRDASAQKQRPDTSMGPPPPQATRPLQPSAKHTNSNLYRPFKTVTPAPESTKKVHPTDSARKEISLASILKRSRNSDSANESARESGRESARKEREFVPRYKRRKVQIANPLYEEYKDCIDTSRETLLDQGRTALNSAFEDLTTYVKELALEKEGQIETIEAQLTSVLAPVNSVKAPGGKTVDVQDKIAAFAKLLEEEEKVVEGKWSEWERVQAEIMNLGVLVLGDSVKDVVPDEIFRRVQDMRPQGGSMLEDAMKELEEELKGPMEEIRMAGEEALKKMAAAEKESEEKFRQQKAKIVAAITMEDD